MKRSARARRISLRVSGLDGRVTLTLPRGVPEREALAFASEKAGWLRAQLSKQPQEVHVAPGAELPVEGRLLRITSHTGRSLRISGDRLEVPGDAESAGARVRAWLKARARDRLAAASDQYAQALGRPYTRISMRDTRSRWGSCTAQGGIVDVQT